MSVAVVAHAGKTFDGGLPELRRLLADRGFTDPLWFEVPKSRKAPARIVEALDQGADLILVWGGDGTVQRCLDAVARHDEHHKAAIGILPAGTANLLAGNLGVPSGLEAALEVALDGDRRHLDMGVVNGQYFAVMAGTGLDALMMKEADAGLKDKVGQLAYIYTGARAVRAAPVTMTVKVDGRKWFDGQAGCLLLGNMGKLTGGLVAFPDARPDDGLLDIGIVTATSSVEWARVLTRLVAGRASRSKLVRITKGRRLTVKLGHKRPYELDGGARPKTKRLKITVAPRAVTVCAPAPSNE
ncbi:MAG TPA: YegS/Rv2252/BmrU family lipid kinase [Acidimicrobiales bacterium]|nr:YegS/Rv2252/BmrU family lipid kinase [Acidimicrobiales bacterium]